jgi:RHS repeat-associated protein
MLGLVAHRPLLRLITLLTVLSFFPSAAGAWNFAPETAVVVEQAPTGTSPVPETAAVTSQPAASTAPAAAPSYVTVLSDAALRATGTGATRAKLAEIQVARAPLPSIDALLAAHPADGSGSGKDVPLTASKAADVAKVKANEEAIVLARNEAVEGVIDALPAQLSSAQAAYNTGEMPSAFEQAVRITEDVPYYQIPDVKTAEDLCSDIVAGASESELDTIEAGIPELWTELEEPYAKERLADFYKNRAARYKEAGDEEQWSDYLTEYTQRVWTLVDEHPNSIFAHYSVEKYAKALTELGLEEEGDEGIEEFARSSTGSVAAAKAWVYLGEKAENAGDIRQAVRCFRRLVAAFETGVYDRLLADESVSGHRVKAARLTAVARAYYCIGKVAEAKELYARAANDFGVDAGRTGGKNYGPVVARYSLAELQARECFDGDVYDGIVALYDFIQEYPGSFYAPDAAVSIGGLYMRARDYAQAAEYLAFAIKHYPDSEAAVQAEGDLDFLMRNMVGTVQVGAVQDGVSGGTAETAMTCGPAALEGLLAHNGIDASVDDLAELAGTDEAGTSMQGLIDAARAKGLPLKGVEAPTAEMLPIPFIAYVNGNHFVLVKETSDARVLLADTNGENREQAKQDFMAMWDGKALICASAAMPGTPLSVESLAAARGGCGAPPPDPYSTEDKPELLCTHPSAYGNGSSNAARRPGCHTCQTGPTDTCDDQSKVQVCYADAGEPPILNGPGSPEAPVGMHADGVNPYINMFKMGLVIEERDIYADVNGPMGMGFTRTFAGNSGGMTPGWNVHGVDTDGDNADEFRPVYAELYGFLAKNSYYVYDSDLGQWVRKYYTTYGLNIEINFANGKSTDHYWEDLVRESGIVYYQQSYWDWYNETVTLADLLTRFYGSTAYTYVDAMQIGYVYEDADDTLSISRSQSREQTVLVEEVKDFEHETSIGYIYGASAITMTAPGSDSRTLVLRTNGYDDLTSATLDAGGGVSKTVSYSYDASRRLTGVSHDGGTTSVTYEYGYDAGADKTAITRITDRAGNSVDFDYEYDASAKCTLITVSLPNGLDTTYEWNATSKVCVQKNWDGQTLLSRHDNWATWNREDSSQKDYYLDTTNYESWEYDYNSSNDLTAVTGPSSEAVADYQYDDYDRLTKQRFMGGPWTTYVYSDADAIQPYRVVGPDGSITQYYFDDDSRITKVTHPSVASAGTVYTFDASNNLSTVTTPLGGVTAFAYDAQGNVTFTANPAEDYSTFTYDAFGNLSTVTDAYSNTTTYEYVDGGCGGCGASGLLTKVTDADGNDTTFAYDANGNMTQVTDALSRVTQYAYDALGQVTRITADPSGANVSMTFAYNKLSQLTSTTDFNGKTTTRAYDHKGRLTSTTDPVDSVTYTYTNLDKISTVTDGLSHTTTYAHDEYAQLTKVTDAIGKVTCYFYDDAGRKTKVGAGATGTIDPTEYFYSTGTELLTKVTYTAGVNTYDAEYEYDGNARLTKLLDWIDAIDGLEYAYDAAGRLTQLTDYDGSTLDYAYDAAGRVTSMNDYFSHATTYTYTDTGQVSTITAPGSKVWTYAYNALGQPTSVSIPNGMTTAYGYDTRNRLTKIEHKDGATVLDGFTYALDDGGNITRTTQADSSLWDYEYDGRDRLTKAERYDTDGTTLLHRYSYTYDDGDNLLTKLVYDGTNTVTTAFAYTDANEQTSMSVGGTTTAMAYDAWGRMTSKADGTHTASYTYGPPGMLSTVTTDFPIERDVTYVTGGDGRRRSRTVDGTETYYNWDAGSRVINEEHSNGTLARTYLGRNQAHVAGTSPSTGDWRYYRHDRVGSSRSIWNENKTSYATLEHSPYGDVYASSGALSEIKRRYTGHDWDAASQLYFAPYRYYSPDGTRWLTRDPLGMVDGPNRYAYVRANPVLYVDTMGTYGFVPDFDRARRERENEPCLLRLRAIVNELRAMNGMMNRFRDPENPTCQFGEIKVILGGLPGRYSFSPRPNTINMHRCACSMADGARLRRWILHEIGHAMDPELNRWRYAWAYLRGDSYYDDKEEFADDFRDSCIY